MQSNKSLPQMDGKQKSRFNRFPAVIVKIIKKIEIRKIIKKNINIWVV